MTDRRRARLERRISEIPVPPPPAGLAERIKRDIPERLPASIAESLTELSPYRIWLRVAAILLVVVASSFVAMQLLVRDLARPAVQTAEVAEADMKRDVAIPPPASIAIPTVDAQDYPARNNVSAPAQSSVLQEVQPAPAKLKSVQARAEERVVLSSPAEEYEAKKREKSQSETASGAAELRLADSVDKVATANVAKEARKNGKDEANPDWEGGVVGGSVGDAAPVAMAQAAPAAPPSTVARKQTPAASGRRADAARGIVSSFYESSTGGFLDAEERAVSTFALEVGTDSYTTASASLRANRLPPPASVRVEEFVNSFDYADPRPSHGDFSLIGDGSVSPFSQGSRYRLLRLGIRPRQGLGNRAATVEVHFNHDVVQRYRLIGYENRGQTGATSDRPAANEQVLSQRGVVALYEVKLQQKYQSKDTLATLRLRYRSSNDELVDITREIAATAVEEAWLDAPRSIQLASIVASFAEVLRGDERVNLNTLANQARFVADRYPGNAGVKELLSLIETAARLKKAETTD